MNKIKLYGLIIVIFATLLSLIPTLSYGATVISGKGTEKNPYVINMDSVSITQVSIEGFSVSGKEVLIEEEVKEEGFWFKFKGSSAPGTYYVNYNKDEKKVAFIKLSNEDRVLSGDEKYIQAGAMPKGTTAEDTFSDTTFTIKSKEECKGHDDVGFKNTKKRDVQLKNAPRPSGIGGVDDMVPDPACFVFAIDGTVQELYEEFSKTNYGSSNYINYSNVDCWYGPFAHAGKIAELKLYADGLGSGLTNYTVRFGDYKNINGNINNQDNYKLDIKYQFKPAEEPTKPEQAGVIETAITWILIAVGEVFMFVIKLFLGNRVTMDAIIFNRYADVIIDLRGKVGPFSVPAVKEIINTMYSGFQLLAIVINIVVLLYIGIQIVMSVGTDKQSKYTKNLQNWVVGVLILFLAPQFFPFLTDITNGIVSYIGKDTQPMYTQYNIIALLDDEDLLGENAQTVDLDKYVSNAVEGRKEDAEELKKEIDNLKINNDATSQSILSGVLAVLGYNNSMDTVIIDYVNNNIDNWTEINEKEFSNLIEQHRANNTSIFAKLYVKTSIQKLTTYKNNSLEIKQLEEEITILEAYAASGGKSDLMSTMRTNAGKTGRVIYAIVWLILIFQMITLLAMYYKRIIMVAILLMIFPIVMIAYALDKINDGAAQTLENWTKEFTINILVQIAHAIIYVTLIQTGLDIYAANEDNWLFLLVAVLFLFPGERILRSIFGLNGSTIGSLKANIGGAIAMGATAGGAAFKLGKGAVKGAKAGIKGGKNLADSIKNKGVKGTASDMWKNTKKAIKNGWNNLGNDTSNDAKDKKRQAVADRKKRARDTNMERRREQMKNAGTAKRAILGAVNAASHVRNGMYKVGNATRKTTRAIRGMKKNAVGKTFKLAGKGIKGGLNAARKLTGATMGIASGVTGGLAAAGNRGVSAGVAQGIQQGKAVNQLVGGPSAKKQEKKEPKDRSMNGNTPLVKGAKHMPGGQKYKRAKNGPAPGKQREGARVVGKTSRKIRGTRKVNKTVNKKMKVKESKS